MQTQLEYIEIKETKMMEDKRNLDSLNVPIL